MNDAVSAYRVIFSPKFLFLIFSKKLSSSHVYCIRNFVRVLLTHGCVENVCRHQMVG